MSPTATPNGSVPVLEYNGETIIQSISIARFLAREFKLVGKNNIEAAKADAIVDACTDVLNRE
jgi:glutathione S-transferase